MAYDSIEPFGEQRADLRAGIIASVVANHSMAPPREARRPSDYMLFAGKHEESDGVILADPKAQSKLLKQTLFGVKE